MAYGAGNRGSDGRYWERKDGDMAAIVRAYDADVWAGDGAARRDEGKDSSSSVVHFTQGCDLLFLARSTTEV